MHPAVFKVIHSNFWKDKLMDVLMNTVSSLCFQFMNLTFRWPWIVINSYNKTNQMHSFLKFIFGIKLYMFRTVPLSIIRSFSLYTQQWYMSYRFADSSQAVSISVWHIPLLCVKWKTPDDGQRNCPKHVEFYSKNKFEKLRHLVGFIIRITVYECCVLNT